MTFILLLLLFIIFAFAFSGFKKKHLWIASSTSITFQVLVYFINGYLDPFFILAFLFSFLGTLLSSFLVFSVLVFFK